MAFWNITGGAQVTTFDADGNAVGTDIDQGSIRHAGNIGETTKFTDVALGEGNPFITVPSGVDYVDPVNGTLPVTSFNLTNSGMIVANNMACHNGGWVQLVDIAVFIDHIMCANIYFTVEH